jgi:8-oxo-dGTP pyrophosphatase MutT (NUDIX family)
MKQKVKVLIEHDGQLLLLKPIGKRKMTLIGGTVDKGESVSTSLVREAWEEAGILMDVSLLSTAYRQLVRINNKWVLFHCFLVRHHPFLFELKERHKFQELDWVPLEKGLKKLRGVERKAAKILTNKFIIKPVEQTLLLGA